MDWMNGRMDGLDQWMDGLDEWKDGWTKERMNGRMEKQMIRWTKGRMDKMKDERKDG